MRHLPLPKDENDQPFNAGEVFETCVSMVRNVALRGQLQALRPYVVAESADYDVKAAGKQLYKKQPHDHVMNVTGVEIVKVYTQRMVPKKSKGNSIYERIKMAPANSICPLCGIGAVASLDHYLPKAEFPVFSVTPNNLVPACDWCQKKKDEYYPTTKGGQLLHPYFDDIDKDIWLAAEVVPGAQAAFRFFASPPDVWSLAAKKRVAAHLKELNLSYLFSINAGSRLSEIRKRLSDLHGKAGAVEVRAYLQDELGSIEADYNNSWVAAMYRAAVANDWFCDGGFR